MNNVEIIENKSTRERLISNIGVLDKVKDLLLLGDSEYATTQQVADYYEVDISVIQKLVSRNKVELESNGLKLNTKNEIQNLIGQDVKLQIIIPNRDIDGDLVGIRARNFDKYVLDKGMKYSPIKLEKKQYSCPTGYNLYGIYENKEAIERIKKCIIVEGEKSVLLYGSYFGCKNNIALATLGSTLSNYQRDIIIDRDVEETIIAYDKDFLYSEIAKDNKEHIKKYNKLIKN